MSLVKIKEHDEVIFRILDQPPPSPPRTPRYESNLERQLRKTKVEQRHRTMGYADVPLNPPSQFLRKGDGITHQTKKATRKCEKTNKLPPVPRKGQTEEKVVKPKVNFRVINVKKAVKSKPKTVEPCFVDHNDGHLQRMKDSGEVPQHALRKVFGRVPKYIINSEKKERKEIEERMREEEQRESICKLINEQERQQLIKDLKTKKQVMLKAFLQLPIQTDTLPKILKKTKMEQELNQLEKDISVIEMNPYIYIYD